LPFCAIAKSEQLRSNRVENSFFDKNVVILLLRNKEFIVLRKWLMG